MGVDGAEEKLLFVCSAAVTVCCQKGGEKNYKEFYFDL